MMEFWDGDKCIHFQGDAQLLDAEISKAGLRRLLAKNNIAYFCYLRSDAAEGTRSWPWPKLGKILEEFAAVLAKP